MNLRDIYFRPWHFIALAFIVAFMAVLAILQPWPQRQAEAAVSGDVNGDGRVNSLDATLILQFDAGLIGSLQSADVHAELHVHSDKDADDHTNFDSHANNKAHTGGRNRSL